MTRDPTRAPLVLLSCGEPSGDVYAASVAAALQRELPAVRLAGVGGARLRGAGVPLWADLDALSVMGFSEVVRHLPRLRRLRNGLAARAEQEGVDLFLPVDYPGFHVSLAGRLARAGIPTLHFIPPKTWSWAGWRVGSLRRSVARCAVIFPFEVEYYRRHGVDARFVGHPLIDRYQRELASPPASRHGLLLVPGSRRQELDRIAPVAGEVAARLMAKGGVDRVRVSRAPEVDPAWLRPILDACPGAEVVEGPLLPALQQARAAVVTSGTATMEAALAGTPHVIVYRTSPFTYAVARALATVEHIGMVNIVLGRRAVPEFLQGGLRADPIVTALAPLLVPGGPAAAAQHEAFAELRRRLGDPGAFERVARLAAEMLDRRGP